MKRAKFSMNKAFKAFKSRGIQFLAVPHPENQGETVQIIDEDGAYYGAWATIDDFKGFCTQVKQHGGEVLTIGRIIVHYEMEERFQ